VAHTCNPGYSAEVRRIKVRSQPGQIVLKILSSKKPITKNSWWMAQGEDPEFKPQYCKKIKNLHMGAIWN
jgi:hypothetical protein